MHSLKKIVRNTTVAALALSGTALDGTILEESTTFPIEHEALGFTVDNLNGQIAAALNLSAKCGVIVHKVIPGSIAAGAGLNSGALILQVNSHPVTSVEQFRAALSRLDVVHPILLLIKEGESIKYLSLNAE